MVHAIINCYFITTREDALAWDTAWLSHRGKGKDQTENTTERHVYIIQMPRTRES